MLAAVLATVVVAVALVGGCSSDPQEPAPWVLARRGDAPPPKGLSRDKRLINDWGLPDLPDATPVLGELGGFFSGAITLPWDPEKRFYVGLQPRISVSTPTWIRAWHAGVLGLYGSVANPEVFLHEATSRAESSELLDMGEIGLLDGLKIVSLDTPEGVLLEPGKEYNAFLVMNITDCRPGFGFSGFRVDLREESQKNWKSYALIRGTDYYIFPLFCPLYSKAEASEEVVKLNERLLAPGW